MQSATMQRVPVARAARPTGRLAKRQSRASRGLAALVRADSCLIVNTKGGGHAFIGLHLAKQLIAKGHKVTIMQDGDKDKVSKKDPVKSYSSVKGLEVVWGNPTDPATFPKAAFDVVYDNNGKGMDECKPLIDHFKGKVKHYVFVGSAGAYKYDATEPQLFESDPRKKEGHPEVEAYLKQEGLPFTVFQPQYIYGPNTAKDCEQWFIDRIIRDRQVPIPKPGVQLVTLTHVEDVASMLAAVPGNKAAIKQMYNMASDRAMTFTGICKALAAGLGKEAKVLLYDPKALGLGDKGKAEGFPFRTLHFFTNVSKAKRELGWTPKHNFMADVPAMIQQYKDDKREAKEPDFAIDDKIIAAVGAK